MTNSTKHIHNVLSELVIWGIKSQLKEQINIASYTASYLPNFLNYYQIYWANIAAKPQSVSHANLKSTSKRQQGVVRITEI